MNLEETKITELNRDGNFDVHRAINEILALTQKKLSSQSVIFIDEIQESIKAYERLRFFYEQRPEVPIIVAGNLLEIALKQDNVSSPVG